MVKPEINGATVAKVRRLVGRSASVAVNVKLLSLLSSKVRVPGFTSTGRLFTSVTVITTI